MYASAKLSTTLETYIFTQHFLKIVLNSLFRQTFMGWHFEVQPADIAKILELPSNNWFFTPPVKFAVKTSNDNIEFWNPGLLHSAWVYFSQISSTHIFIKSSNIQAFSCVLTMKPGGMIRLQVIMSENIYPSAVADNKTVTCLFLVHEERITHPHLSLQYIFMRPCQKMLVLHSYYRQLKRDTLQFP